MEEIRYFEVVFPDFYSIIIKGLREPTILEAKDFLKTDMETMGYTDILSIEEWELPDAMTAFDFSSAEKWPIFGS